MYCASPLARATDLRSASCGGYVPIPPRTARAHTEMGVKVLAGIASAEDAPPAARVSAAQALLDRGWGKAPQPHTGEDDKDIRVTIRNITEGKG